MGIKSKVRVMNDINGQLTEVALRPVNAKTGTFRWKGTKYTIDMTVNISRRKNAIVYGYCINRGQLLSTADVVPTDSTQLGRQVLYKGIQYSQSYDEMTNDKSALKAVFAGLTSQVSKSGIFDASIIGLIICVVMGLFAGIFVSRFF